MPTKTIVATVTLHVPGPAFKPFVFTDGGSIKSGKYDVSEVAPGTPVKLDADEADRLIKRGIAEDYVPPAAVAPPAVIEAAKE
jgi:hypothetical protein